MPDYFTLDELRSLPDMSNSTKYDDDRCTAAAAYIVGVIEREVGTSFVGRTVTDEVHDGGSDRIVLKRRALSVTSATENGAAVTATLLVRDGVLRKVSGTSNTAIAWLAGNGNVKVTYQSGYSSTPPADVKEQALKGTRAHLLSTGADSSMNERRTSLNTEMGVINYITAGSDHPTGYPELDAMIVGWRNRLDVLGFA